MPLMDIGPLARFISSAPGLAGRYTVALSRQGTLHLFDLHSKRSRAACGAKLRGQRQVNEVGRDAGRDLEEIKRLCRACARRIFGRDTSGLYYSKEIIELAYAAYCHN